MIENGVVVFTLLFASIIALICAVYVALIERKKRIEIQKQINITEEN